MEIQQLRGFHAVAKYKNFTVAAQKTKRTQPTISLQVKALEDELGVKLFERLGPKKVTLTPEGKILLDLTAPLLNEVESIRTRFNEALGKFHTSTVRIMTHSSVMIYLLPAIIKRFKDEFPECQLQILNRSRHEMITMLENGEADFGITSLSHIPPHIEYSIFSRFNRILIATKDHPISSHGEATLEDIVKYPLILPTQESTTRKIIDQLFERHGLTPDITMEVVGRTAIKTYVEMNLGLSIINEYYVNDEDKKRLYVQNVSQYFGAAETGIIVRKGRMMSYPARKFIDLVIGQAAEW